MSLPLAAVGAVVLALLESSVAPHLMVAGVKPDLVFVVVVVVAAIFGLGAAVGWAFVGGLMIDLLSPPDLRPLGTSAFSLLVVAGLAAGAARFLPRERAGVAILLAFLLTFAYEALVLALFGVAGAPVPVVDPLRAMLPIALLDAALAVPLAFGLRYLARRYGPQERLQW